MKQENNLKSPNVSGGEITMQKIEKNVNEKECRVTLTLKEKRAMWHLKSKEKNNARSRNFRKNNTQYFIDYRNKNIEKIKQKDKEYRFKTREQRGEYERTYIATHKESIRRKQSLYYLKNKEYIDIRNKEYYKNHISERKAYAKDWGIKNRIFRNKRNQEYYLKNKDKIKEYASKNRDRINMRRRLRLQSDIPYKLSCYLRIRMWQAIRGKTKVGSAAKDLGCSLKYFKHYISGKFITGMTWENYGNAWHLDHIIPLSSFDLTNREEFLKAVHYTNIQPLWATTAIARENGDMTSIGNLEKGDKISC